MKLCLVSPKNQPDPEFNTDTFVVAATPKEAGNAYRAYIIERDFARLDECGECEEGKLRVFEAPTLSKPGVVDWDKVQEFYV